jgi:hypothetical protein
MQRTSPTSWGTSPATSPERSSRFPNGGGKIADKIRPHLCSTLVSVCNRRGSQQRLNWQSCSSSFAVLSTCTFAATRGMTRLATTLADSEDRVDISGNLSFPRRNGARQGTKVGCERM